MKDRLSLNIIIPFYRRLDFLERLLKNISEIYAPVHNLVLLELIIVNDSPEVDPLPLLKTFNNIPYIYTINIKNIGVAASRNRGLDLAKAKYVLSMDQDDRYEPTLFDLLYRAEKENLDFLLMNGILFHEKKSKSYRIFYFKPRLTLKNLILYNFIRSPGQVLLNRSTVGDLRFPEPVNNKGSDDSFFWILLFLKIPRMKAAYDKCLAYTAILHDQNFSYQSSELFQCSKELWNQFDMAEFGSNQKYVKENKRVLAYLIDEHFSFINWFAYFRHKYRFNRMFRYALKFVS